MLVADQVEGVAEVPLNVTVLDPLVAPKFAPVMVTEVPTFPLVGERLVKVGAAVPPPLPARNAATAAPQPSLAPNVAVTAVAPAVVCR